jgi:hypothetical protein
LRVAFLYGEAWLLEGQAHPLALGRPLPTLPLWLAHDFAVPLELEASFEKRAASPASRDLNSGNTDGPSEETTTHLIEG